MTHSPDYYDGKHLGQYDRERGFPQISENTLRTEWDATPDFIRGYHDGFQNSHTQKLLDAFAEWDEYGYVTDDEGNAVEPDAPSSPLRKAGFI